MSAPRVVATSKKSHLGYIKVITESDGFTRGWTVKGDHIFGGPINFGGPGGPIKYFEDAISTDRHVYGRPDGDEWWSCSEEGVTEKVCPKLAEELDLVEWAAAVSQTPGFTP
jgi:hypothetical protein